jgi:hypothetical protein
MGGMKRLIVIAAVMCMLGDAAQACPTGDDYDCILRDLQIRNRLNAEEADRSWERAETEYRLRMMDERLERLEQQRRWDRDYPDEYRERR